MYKEVMVFNQERNQLKWDMNLELNMIREEIKEFWDAETVAERMDAFVDTEYVWLGTQMKASYNTVAISDELMNSVRQTLGIMADILAEELGMWMAECYNNARSIVCEINAMKGTKKTEGGKVEKHKGLRDATKEIALMIEAVTKPTREY